MSDRFRVPGLLAERLREQRLSLPAILASAGLPAGFLEQEKIFVSTDELFALWRAIGEASGDPAIGLKLGTESRIERYDPRDDRGLVQPIVRRCLAANGSL